MTHLKKILDNLQLNLFDFVQYFNGTRKRREEKKDITFFTHVQIIAENEAKHFLNFIETFREEILGK